MHAQVFKVIIRLQTSDLKKQQGKCLMIILLHINTNCEKFQMVFISVLTGQPLNKILSLVL